MLNGQPLDVLARELMKIRDTKRDFALPVSSICMEDNANLEIAGEGEFKPSSWAHQQTSVYTDVPKHYYDRLLDENKPLLAMNVNHGLERNDNAARAVKKTETRLIRTYEKKARAVLSTRYKIIDSTDLMQTVLPVLLDYKFKIVSSELTEKRLYIKAVTDRVETEIGKGDVVQQGIIVSTSDVGAGSLRIEPLLYRLVCLNGLIANDLKANDYELGEADTMVGVSFRHTGRRLDDGSGGVREIFSDETKALEDSSFWSKVRDLVLHNLKPEVFENTADILRQAANRSLKNPKLDRVIELTAKNINVNEQKIKDQALMELISGGDLSQWGLINAFTKAAHATEGIDYDRSTEIERNAFKIVNLPKKEWELIAAV